MPTITKYHSPRKFQNLSSALSYRLYGQILGTQMTWVPQSSCHDHLIAGGRNLAHVGYKSHIWCGGYSKPYGPSKRPAKIHSVRGPLSQARLKQHMNLIVPCAGDPLLLISDIEDVPDSELKPCYLGSGRGMLSTLSRSKDARHVSINDSLDTILIAVKNASYVVTDFLEGLVIADSYSTKVTYVRGDQVPFHVRDYLENFNESPADTIRVNDIKKVSEAKCRRRNVSSLKSTLLSSMPDV